MLALVKLGRETGRRYDSVDLVTPQELALLQSGRGAEGIFPTKNPYKPVAFEKLPTVDIGRLRSQRSSRGWNAQSLYFGLDENVDYGIGTGIVRVTREFLDNKGNTLRDPRPLDAGMKLITAYTKSANFPFRRD